MVASLLSVNINLNVAPAVQSIVMPSVQPDLHVVHPECMLHTLTYSLITPNKLIVYHDVWQPTFVFDNHHIIIHDSVVLNDSIAMA
jgi:hypothetical protein